MEAGERTWKCCKCDRALVMKRDPMEYVRKLRFHRAVISAGEYGLARS